MKKSWDPGRRKDRKSEEWIGVRIMRTDKERTAKRREGERKERMKRS